TAEDAHLPLNCGTDVRQRAELHAEILLDQEQTSTLALWEQADVDVSIVHATATHSAAAHREMREHDLRLLAKEVRDLSAFSEGVWQRRARRCSEADCHFTRVGVGHPCKAELRYDG